MNTDAYPPPKSLDISPDVADTYAWNDQGESTEIACHWPDMPELSDLEERLVAWAGTYERRMYGVHDLIEVYDLDDEPAYYARGEALAKELARLLAPKGVRVTFLGRPIEA